VTRAREPKAPPLRVPKLKDRPKGMPIEVARALQKIIRGAARTRKAKAPCEVCIAPATIRCCADKHAVCDGCMMFYRCGCKEQS